MSSLSSTFAFDRFSDMAGHPGLHVRELLILISLAAVVALILVVLYILVQLRFSKKQAKKLNLEELEKRTKHQYISVTVLSVFMVVMLVIAAQFSAKPTFCSGCHEMDQANKRSTTSVHKGVSCLSCHQEPGLSGALIQKLEFAEMLAEKTGVIGDVSMPAVGNRICLRCHGSISEGVRTVGAVRVEHARSLEAGYICTDCHFRKGLYHANITKLEKSVMSRCADCHDGRKAPSSCSTCHTLSAGGGAYIDRSKYSKVETSGSMVCKMCHAQNMCLDCHKILIPHQRGWEGSGHAYEAFTAKKLCFECHQKKDCLRCHKTLFPHGENWPRKHGAAAKESEDECSRCHQTERFCKLCHKDPTISKR